MNEDLENFEVEWAAGSVAFKVNAGIFAAHAIDCIFIKVGDNPDADMLRKLLPGAEPNGRTSRLLARQGGHILQVYNEENPWDPNDLRAGFFKTYIKAGKTTFTAYVIAHTEDHCRAILKATGALRLPGEPQADFWERTKLILRWYWLRRPRLVFYKPLPL